MKSLQKITKLFEKIHVPIQTDHEKMDLYELGVLDNWQMDIVHLHAGQTYEPHIHDETFARILIVSGTGTISIGSTQQKYKAKDEFRVFPKTAHGFVVEEDTFLLSLQNPPILHEDGTLDFRYPEKPK